MKSILKGASLKYLIPFFIFIVLAISSVINAHLIQKHDTKNVVKQQADTALVIGRRLANEIEQRNLHFKQNHVELNRQLAYYSLNNLTSAAIIKSNNGILYQQEMVQNAPYILSDMAAQAMMDIRADYHIDLEERYIQLAMPLIVAPDSESLLQDETMVMVLNFDISNALYETNQLFIDNLVRTIVTLILLTVLITYILYFFIFKRIKPLEKISKAVIKDQNYAQRITGDSYGELYQITKAFNEMLDSIERSQTELTSRLDETQQLNKALKQANKTTERALQAKSEFLSSMSHEFKTPLNAIIGFSQLLALSEINDHQRKQLHNIESSGKHLLELITQVLELAKIEAGSHIMNIENYPLNTLVEESVDMIHPMLAKHNVVFSPVDYSHFEHLVRVDYTRTKQVLINFLSNAIKYNKPHGTVKVDAYPATLQGHKPAVRVCISDTGIGIPDKLKPYLFEPFNRLGQEGKSIEGTGIGLSICKTLIEDMGGEMTFSSTEGAGSTFCVTLPLSDLNGEQEESIK